MPEPRPSSDTIFTWPGVLLGMRRVIPTLPGIVAFSLAFGTASSQKGLSLAESVAMSAFMCAGASQMLSLELWRDVWNVGAIVTVALVTAAVNARFILQGASLQPWLRSAPAAPRTLSVALLFESSWIVAERHRAEGGRDVGVMLGAGLLCWAVWTLATVPGYLAGALVTEPGRYGLDLVMPLFFATMAVPLWKGFAVSARPWTVAALVATAVQAAVPGYLFIVVGALAGALTAGLSHGRR